MRALRHANGLDADLQRDFVYTGSAVGVVL
jgi:hypothetical protein